MRIIIIGCVPLNKTSNIVAFQSMQTFCVYVNIHIYPFLLLATNFSYIMFVGLWRTRNERFKTNPLEQHELMSIVLVIYYNISLNDVPLYDYSP